MSELPDPPAIQLTLVPTARDGGMSTGYDPQEYLQVRRRTLRAHYPRQTTPSADFRYDMVERWLMDAVAIVPHYLQNDVHHVILRSAVRPPLGLRSEPFLSSPEFPLVSGVESGNLWEIPAGLVEKEEQNAQGLRACAVREIQEELGLSTTADQLHPLGGALLPSPGIMGEVIYLFHVEVDVTQLAQPQGDGSPLEHGAAFLHVPLAQALSWCDGRLPDAKTEIGLRRLAQLYAPTSGAVAGR